MGHAGTAAAAVPVGGDLEHSTETVEALSSELAQQQVQPAWLRQPDIQQQQQLTQPVSQPAIMQQAPQHLRKDTLYQQLQHQGTQYQQLLVQYQALQQQNASLAVQLQQQQRQQQPQALQHSMSQGQQRQQEHEHNLLQLHAGDQGRPSQQQALEQPEQRLHPEGQAQAEPLLAGTVECCAPTGTATSKASAGEEQGLTTMASGSGTGSRGMAAEPVAGPQQRPLVSAPEGVSDESLGTLADNDGGSSMSGAAASTSASSPVSAAAAASSDVDSASSAAASNAGADGTAPLRSMQRVSSSHMVTQSRTVTSVTTSNTSTAHSTEHSSSSDGGGGTSRDAGSDTNITASSSQQHLTFNSVQQHSEAGVLGEVTAGFMGSSACLQSADAQAPAQVQTGALVASGSAGSLAAALPVLPTGQLLFLEDFHATGLSPSLLSNSPASRAGSAGFLPPVLPGLLVPSASAAAAAAAGFAAPDFNSPAAPFGSSRMGGHHTPAELQVNSRSFGSSDSFGSSSNSPVAGGSSLAGFVSIATYQEQMQSVAKLHGDVGQLAVQLREAHADAEGAQQLLQQERKVRAHCYRLGKDGWRGRRW